MNRQPVNLVDVRSFDEYKKGRINNSINIPLDQLADNLGKLKKSPNKTLLLYCQKGFRPSWLDEPELNEEELKLFDKV